ncbi:PREDICTED: chymotrypsin inhibitor-like [Polistes canadensis]|uniref:chymotrypsin inhibitor-like n=1 Tax=Polistes canadensis TaxID=91411 RepID=UPI000718EA55|nr:PREDICTED: chymotrypsin inhibitor-like [Polistes canadensis]
MSRVIFALLVLVAVASALPPSQKCNENEEFTTCGSACEPTCGVTTSDICTLQCIIGCQCKQGFLRQLSTGACISEANC